MPLTLQVDPPWHWLQTVSWRPAHCHFHLSQTPVQWPNPSASERDLQPGLWPAPLGRERVLIHDLSSAPGSGLHWQGRESGGHVCQASSAQWSKVAHCLAHCHPSKTEQIIITSEWIIQPHFQQVIQSYLFCNGMQLFACLKVKCWEWHQKYLIRVIPPFGTFPLLYKVQPCAVFVLFF